MSDRGYNIKLRTSYRLLSEVLYLEHKRTRYELCAEEKTPSSSQSLEPVIRYRFSIVLNPISVSRQVVTRPLPETSLNILYQDLEWRSVVRHPSILPSTHTHTRLACTCVSAMISSLLVFEHCCCGACHGEGLLGVVGTSVSRDTGISCSSLITF